MTTSVATADGQEFLEFVAASMTTEESTGAVCWLCGQPATTTVPFTTSTRIGFCARPDCPDTGEVEQ